MHIFSDSAVQYTIYLLFKIAGCVIKKSEVKFNRRESLIIAPVDDTRQVIFKVMQKKDIKQLVNDYLSMQTIASFDGKIDIPVFYPIRNESFASISNHNLIIHADIVTLSFIMLSRYEEIIFKERDIHDRFEYQNSLAFKYNFIDIPIVDEYAMLLRKWLLKFIPGYKIIKENGRIVPTHDVDNIFRFGGFYRNTKTIIGGDIIKRKSLMIALKSVKQCIKASNKKKEDPLILAIKELIDVSSKAGLRSEFYFLAQRIGQNDSRYDIFWPEVKYCFDLISSAGMIIGVHGGYDSYNNEQVFKQEKKDIESIYNENITKGRQHYLRFDINNTIKVWHNCGMKQDSTLGYAEREGFRCGTCHEYYLYDFQKDNVSEIKERPLIVMDKTLFEYRGMSIEEARVAIGKLKDRCLAVGGNFVINWHNECLFRDYENRYRKVYCNSISLI